MTDEQVRARLAEAYPMGDEDPAKSPEAWLVADALLPVVQAIADERAAEELEAEAAYDDAAPDEQYARYLFAQRLRARANNLRDRETT